VHSFSWSPDGSTLLIQGDSLSWSAFTPSIGSLQLPFKAVWAAALAAGLGYVYIDVNGTLHRLSVDGADEVIASNVSDAAGAPNGLRVAYVRSSGSVSTVWGYDVGLRSRYELVTETGPLSDLSWSPSGSRIAYLREDSGGIALRVRSFTGQAATTTVATGDIGHPTWLPDSTHVVFAAGVTTASGQQRKAFLVNAIAPPAALTAALAIPSSAVEVADPVPSPDGHQIAFVSQNQVWMMNADGTRPTALTRFDAASFPYSCLTPAWTRL
jgi:Tol biopolymer transport system component